jgi:hypothetical protein
VAAIDRRHIGSRTYVREFVASARDAVELAVVASTRVLDGRRVVSRSIR